jgi:molybdopterin-guanine dinucleotide biosynthesis protein A
MRMTSFWRDVRVIELGPPQLRAFGDPEVFFRNVNTPADLQDASSATSAAARSAGRRRRLRGR